MAKDYIFSNDFDVWFKDKLVEYLSDLDTREINTNTRINEIVAQTGNSNTEIVDARLGEPTLRAKIESVDSQLTEKAQQSEVDVLSTTVIYAEHFERYEGETDDTGKLQRAIDSLKPNGGRIFLDDKTYLVTSLSIPSYVTLEGAGKTTIIKQLPNVSNSPVLKLEKPSSQLITLRNFFIDGDNANQTTLNEGIKFENSVDSSVILVDSLVNEHDSRHYIENVYVNNTKGDGVVISGRGESQLVGVQVRRANGKGFNLSAFDNWYSNLSAGDCGEQGFLYTGTNCRFTNSKAWFCGRYNQAVGYGFHIDGGRASLAACEAQDNANHGFFFDGYDTVGSALLSDANGWQERTGLEFDNIFGYAIGSGAVNTRIDGIASDRFYSGTGSYNSKQSGALKVIDGAKYNQINIGSRGNKIDYSPISSSVPTYQTNDIHVYNIGDTTITADPLSTNQLNKVNITSFLNSWNLRTGYENCYRVFPKEGRIDLTINITGGLTSGTVNLFNFPTGLTPVQMQNGYAICHNGTTVSLCGLQLMSSGKVEVFNVTGNNWLAIKASFYYR